MIFRRVGSLIKKFLSKLDPKFVKVCAYAGATVLLVLITIVLLHASSPFWSKLWALFCAVLRPVVLGLIFAYLLTPIVDKLEGTFRIYQLDKAARPIAVIVGVLIFVAIIAAFLTVVAVLVYKSINSMRIDGIRELIEYAKNDFAAFLDIVQKKLLDFGLSISTIRQIITAFANAVTKLASGLLFGAIFSIYFLMDTTRISSYWSRAYHLIAGHKAEAQFLQFCKDADTVFSGYIRGQFIDASIVGVLTSLVLSIVDIPSAVIIGILTGFGNLIPYVGPIVGYMTLALICLSSGAYVKLAIGAVCLALILFVDGNILNPKLLSNNIKIHPLLVILALIGGGAIGGFVGMIVGVPIAALLKLQLDRYLDSKEATLHAIQEGGEKTTQIADEAHKELMEKNETGKRKRRKKTESK